jgi:putative endonuclease
VWSCEFERIDDAWAAERRIHGWSRAKKLALIEGRLADLPELAKARAAKPASGD